MAYYPGRSEENHVSVRLAGVAANNKAVLPRYQLDVLLGQFREFRRRKNNTPDPNLSHFNPYSPPCPCMSYDTAMTNS
jgi:hypothetical protein